ncbi:MAG: ABC transporter permease subunit [Hyphomicrobiaceae bacterium]|nr:ABC transporter permease subunit [Hyphomicrobiaceae bacterium]
MSTEPSQKKPSARPGALISLAYGAGVLALWFAVTQAELLPAYLLPSPMAVLERFWKAPSGFLHAAWLTMRTALAALFAAVLGGVALGAVATRSPLLERIVYPPLAALQVTPVIVLAPLVVIFVPTSFLQGVLLAFLVAFFPMVTATISGIRSVDPRLADLFRLYGASGHKRLWLLELAHARGEIAGALRVAGGLSLIGAVVAEFAATSHAGGLAARLYEATYRLDMASAFTALLLVIVLGLFLQLVLGMAGRLLLSPWHPSVRASGTVITPS